jgi:hypothetical protein
MRHRNMNRTEQEGSNTRLEQVGDMAVYKKSWEKF